MKTTALYTEVYNKILNGIRSGEYPENTPLPAERFLCEKYHVSRSTLRVALNLLNKENIVCTMPGSGTFIQPAYFEQPLNAFYSFADTLKKQNMVIKNDIISYNLVSADQTLIQKTRCKEGTVFHKVVRLRMTRDCPLMLESSFLPQERFPEMELNEFVQDSMYDFLSKKYSFQRKKAKEWLRPVLPLPREKELLQIYRNIPCMLLERFTYEESGLSEYTRSVIRGDKYVFSVNLE